MQRIGQGFDLHALQPGDGLMLGGVFFPCRFSVRAHSDGDVLLHALGDALLGAAGLDDIGRMYPSDDERHRNLAGSELIAGVLRSLSACGMRPVNVDLTLICEQPRLAERRQQVRRSIADMLSLPASAVGVKATTTDRLGAVGSGKGIAAMAVALIQAPE